MRLKLQEFKVGGPASYDSKAVLYRNFEAFQGGLIEYRPAVRSQFCK